MDFKYNPKKTLQAASLFLKLNNQQPMEYMRLIKLLYLADKKALDERGETITGDRYVSMDYGPVLSHVYDLINHGPNANPGDPWFEFISAPKSYRVELLQDPGVGKLCKREENLIEETFEAYGDVDIWDLSRWTHSLTEWTDPEGSSVPIKIEDMLRDLGKSDEKIQKIREDIEADKCLEAIFSGDLEAVKSMGCIEGLDYEVA